MHYTVPQFMNKIVDGWKLRKEPNGGVLIFMYWSMVLQARALTHWNAVVNEHAKEANSRTFELWQACVRYYFEKLVGFSFIGNQLIHMVLT